MDRYDTIREVCKFNEVHDRLGRFASSGGGGTASVGPTYGNTETLEEAISPYGKNHQSDYNNIAMVLRVDPDEAMGMDASIQLWSEDGFRDIRRSQRGEPLEDYDEDYIKEREKDLESFIEKSKKWGDNGAIYRGIGVDDGTYKSIIENAQSGQPITQMGTSSWTSDKGIATYGFGSDQGNHIIFVSEKGTMMGTPINGLTPFDEKEILVSKNQRTRATKIDVVGRRTFIYVEEI